MTKLRQKREEESGERIRGEKGAGGSEVTEPILLRAFQTSVVQQCTCRSAAQCIGGSPFTAGGKFERAGLNDTLALSWVISDCRQVV